MAASQFNILSPPKNFSLMTDTTATLCQVGYILWWKCEPCGRPGSPCPGIDLAQLQQDKRQATPPAYSMSSGRQHSRGGWQIS